MNRQSKTIIYSRYLGNKVFVRYDNRLLRDYLDETGKSYELIPIVILFSVKHGNPIMLKPVSDMTEEHIRLVSPDDTELFMELFDLYGSVSFSNGECQLLQQLGYALPQSVIEDGVVMNYTVEELVESNIYKLI